MRVLFNLQIRNYIFCLRSIILNFILHLGIFLALLFNFYLAFSKDFAFLSRSLLWCNFFPFLFCHKQYLASVCVPETYVELFEMLINGEGSSFIYLMGLLERTLDNKVPKFYSKYFFTFISIFFFPCKFCFEFRWSKKQKLVNGIDLYWLLMPF